MRLDGFADTALVHDPGFGPGLRNYTGLGAALEAPAPFGMLIPLEWGFWNSAQHGVEPRPANRRVRRLPIDAALQLHACDNRHEYSALECGYLLRDHGVAIAQMDRDIGVEQERHRQRPSRSGSSSSSRSSMDGGTGNASKRAIISGMEVAAG